MDAKLNHLTVIDKILSLLSNRTDNSAVVIGVITEDDKTDYRTDTVTKPSFDASDISKELLRIHGQEYNATIRRAVPMYLEYLVENRMIERVGDKYAITVQGWMFEQSGGFQQQDYDKHQSQRKEELLEKNQLGLQRTQIEMMGRQNEIQDSVRALTRYLLVAAIVAGTVALAALVWDVWKYFHPHP